jgi:hypothetical protein
LKVADIQESIIDDGSSRLTNKRRQCRRVCFSRSTEINLFIVPYDVLRSKLHTASIPNKKAKGNLRQERINARYQNATSENPNQIIWCCCFDGNDDGRFSKLARFWVHNTHALFHLVFCATKNCLSLANQTPVTVGLFKLSFKMENSPPGRTSSSAPLPPYLFPFIP